jgi:hypothetical protein
VCASQVDVGEIVQDPTDPRKSTFKAKDYGRTIFIGHSVLQRERLMSVNPVMIIIEGEATSVLSQNATYVRARRFLVTSTAFVIAKGGCDCPCTHVVASRHFH